MLIQKEHMARQIIDSLRKHTTIILTKGYSIKPSPNDL